jgi:hypothetical protein
MNVSDAHEGIDEVEAHPHSLPPLPPLLKLS